jgi:hypothetical protein
VGDGQFSARPSLRHYGDKREARILEQHGLLFGVQPSNPITIGAFVLLAAVFSLAIYIPARRATLVTPLISLREQ